MLLWLLLLRLDEGQRVLGGQWHWDTQVLYSWWLLLLRSWHLFFLQDCVTYCMQVTSLFHHVESSPFCNWYYLFTLSFLSKQTRRVRNVVSCFYLFIYGRSNRCSSLEQCVGSSTRADAFRSSCSLPKYLERWPAALYEAGRSVLILMKGSKILRTELSTVHLYQHYSLLMPNKLLYTWRGDYCEWVRPAQLPVLIEVRAPSLLEQYPRYVPHRDRAGYNTGNRKRKSLAII
jgi:hypothetical protein